MICEFCKNKLSTLSSLNYHKKTNKACLKIQLEKEQDVNKDIDKEKDIGKNMCEFCNKSLTSIQTFKVHIKNCKVKKEINKLKMENEKEIEKIKMENEKEIEKIKMEHEIEMEKLENEIIKLKTQNEYLIKDRELVHKIASQPKNSNSNNKINVINNIFSNPEKVKQIVETQLTQNHIVDGQKGIAQFAYNTLLKDEEGNTNYFCTDSSRSIFKFQNPDGELEKDVKANKLTNLIVSSGLKNKTVNIANELWTNEDGTINIDNFRLFNTQANEIIMIQTDNSVFRNELACLTSS